MIAPSTNEADNSNEVKKTRPIAAKLGVRAMIKNACPRDFVDKHRFTRCHATPLGGVFDASQSFHLCCDARGLFVLTDDYTRDDWQEMPRLRGGEHHRELIGSSDPRKRVGCAKHPINEVLDSPIVGGDRPDRLNFI